jgi:PAS domain-containing protein
MDPFWKNHAYGYLSEIIADSEQPHGWKAPLHPEDWPRVHENFRRLLEGPQSLRLEFRVRNTSPGPREDGETNEWRWVLSNATSEVDEHGNVSKITSFLTDIMYHKRMEQFRRRA